MKNPTLLSCSYLFLKSIQTNPHGCQYGVALINRCLKLVNGLPVLAFRVTLKIAELCGPVFALIKILIEAASEIKSFAIFLNVNEIQTNPHGCQYGVALINAVYQLVNE